MDLIPLLGIYVIAILILIDHWQEKVDITALGCILSIVTFLMWFKFLYFFRLFEDTGYLIRMIIEVLKGMTYFFIIMTVTTAAFGDTFWKLSMVNEYPPGGEDEGPNWFIVDFADGVFYGYRMIIGDFDVSIYGGPPKILLCLFMILCTIFNMIVMLNLLVGIIGDIYGTVTGMSSQTTYQVRCQMIAENHYLIP